MILASEYDFHLRVGSYFERILKVVDTYNSPVDITGATFDGRIFHSILDGDVRNLPVHAEPVAGDEDEGIYRIWIGADESRNFFSQNKMTPYWQWRLFITFPATHPIYPGKTFQLKEGRVVPVYDA